MLTTQLTLPCPAKLNLFLHILGRREDGYHELQTLFQLLDYGDSLTLTARRDSRISFSTDNEALNTPDNLVYRAAKLLQASTQCQFGADLQLSKVLPFGGGIGGGSSDAASTLLGLNTLWQTGLSLEQLAELGQSLGADIPVFVKGRTAWAEGIGERLEPVDLPERWYVVIAPACQVSTASIFSHKELTRDSIAIKVRAFLEEGGHNDCQPLVERLYPQVREAVNWLDSYGRAQLTGTGACIFAPFSSQSEAQQVLANRPDQLIGFVAKGVNSSPVHNVLRLITNGV